MSHIEIQRTWVVADVDPDIYQGPGVHIVQGYLVTPPATSLRVRVVRSGDGTRAFMTGKRGIGAARSHEENELPAAFAERLLGYCMYRLEKRRYTCQEWVIDVFEGRLKGLVTAQRDFERVDQPFVPPAWMTLGREVTGSLTNLHLAMAEHDLDEDAAAWESMERALPASLPRLVLTGGPCSGKSSVMRVLAGRFAAQAHFVPEVASILIAQVGVLPPAKGPDQRRFQRVMARVQRSFELASNDQAIRDGKKVLILDRGTLDIAAYLDGGVGEYEDIMRCTAEDEYREYAKVLFLAQPPEDVYGRYAADNPARRESYDEALELSSAIEDAWGEHPDFTIVDMDAWDEKVAAVVRHVEEFIRRYR